MRCIMGVLSVLDRNINNTCVTYARHGTEIHGLHVLDIHNRHAVQIHDICMIVRKAVVIACKTHLGRQRVAVMC